MSSYVAPKQELSRWQQFSRWFSRPDNQIKNILVKSSQTESSLFRGRVACSRQFERITNAYNKLAYEHLDVVNAIIALWNHRTEVAFSRNMGGSMCLGSKEDHRLLENVKGKIQEKVNSLEKADLAAKRCFQRTLKETTAMLDVGYEYNLHSLRSPDHPALAMSIKQLVEEGIIFDVAAQDAVGSRRPASGIFTKGAVRLLRDRNSRICLETDDTIHALDEHVKAKAELDLDKIIGGSKPTSQHTEVQNVLDDLWDALPRVLNTAEQELLDRAKAEALVENVGKSPEAIRKAIQEKQDAVTPAAIKQRQCENYEQLIGESIANLADISLDYVETFRNEKQKAKLMLSLRQAQASQSFLDHVRMDLTTALNKAKEEILAPHFEERADLEERYANEIEDAQKTAFNEVIDEVINGKGAEEGRTVGLSEKLGGVFTPEYLRARLLGSLEMFSTAKRDLHNSIIGKANIEKTRAEDEVIELEEREGVLEHLIANLEGHQRYAQTMISLMQGKQVPVNFNPADDFPEYIHGQKGQNIGSEKYPEYFPDDPELAAEANEALSTLEALRNKYSDPEKGIFIIANYHERLNGRVTKATKALRFRQMQEVMVRQKITKVVDLHRRARGTGAMLREQIDVLSKELEEKTEKVRACVAARAKELLEQEKFGPEGKFPEGKFSGDLFDYDFSLSFTDEQKQEIVREMHEHVIHFATLENSARRQLGNEMRSRAGRQYPMYRPAVNEPNPSVLALKVAKLQEIDRLEGTINTARETAKEHLLVARLSQKEFQLEQLENPIKLEKSSRIRTAQKTEEERARDIQVIFIREREREEQVALSVRSRLPEERLSVAPVRSRAVHFSPEPSRHLTSSARGGLNSRHRSLTRPTLQDEQAGLKKETQRKLQRVRRQRTEKRVSRQEYSGLERKEN